MSLKQIYDDKYFNEIGRQLTQFREDLNYSLKDISDISGFSVFKLTNIEQGEDKSFLKVNLHSFFVLCSYLRKKIVITFEDLPPEYVEDRPGLNKDQLLRILAQRL